MTDLQDESDRANYWKRRAEANEADLKVAQKRLKDAGL